MKVKVTCSCETRFEFEVEPVHNRMPMPVSCPSCGADATELANAVIQQQAATARPKAIVAKVAPPAQPAPAAPAVPTSPPGAMRVARPAPAAPASPAAPAPPPPPQPPAQSALRKAAQAAAPQPAAAAPAESHAEFCPKHQTNPAVDHCRVCGKPICAKCMEQFGYLCSVFCREQAVTKRMKVPTFAGQKRGIQAKSSSKGKVIGFSVAAVLLLLISGYIWYSMFARDPKVVFAVDFPIQDKEDLEATEFKAEDHYELISPNRLLALKDKRVSLMDVLKKQDLWTTPLQTDAEMAVEKTAKDKNAEIVKNAPMIRDGDGRIYKRIQGLDPVAWRDEQELSAPRVILTTNDIWMVFRTRLFRLDRQTGAKKDLNIADQIIGLTPSTNCILVSTRSDKGARALTRIDVADGSQQSEEITPATATRGSTTATSTPGVRPTMASTTPTNRPAGNPMTMAAGTRSTSPGARATAPTNAAKAAGPGPRGTASGTAPQMTAAATGAAAARKSEAPDFTDYFDSASEPFIPVGPNVVEFKTKLLQRRTVERQAMRPAPAPGNSVLDDKNLTASRGIDLAEEMANQSQREATGGVEIQNVSRYEVTLHRRFAAGVEDWKGEVIGQPAFVPLETVDLVTGFTNVIAFDKSNKKLWEAKLTFPITYYSRYSDDLQQPALETKDAIYFADKGMLTRFDKDTGNPRWRFNSVGITRVTADTKGDIYLDTSTATPDSIKFSQEISFREKTELQIVKVEGATGKQVWNTKFQSNQYRCQPSGKFLYSTRTWEIQDPLRFEEGPDTLFNIKLLRPSDGSAIWTFPVIKRHPTGSQIQDNWILLRFHDRIVVLKFFSL